MKKIEISEEEFFWLVISKIDKSKKDEMEKLHQAIKFLAKRSEEERELFYRMFTEKIALLDISKGVQLIQLDLKGIQSWVIGMGEYYYHCVLDKPDLVREGNGKTFHQLIYLKEKVDKRLDK